MTCGEKTLCYTIRYATDTIRTTTIYLVAIAEGGNRKISLGLTIDILPPVDVSKFGGGISSPPYTAGPLAPLFELEVKKDF